MALELSEATEVLESCGDQGEAFVGLTASPPETSSSVVASSVTHLPKRPEEACIEKVRMLLCDLQIFSQPPTTNSFAGLVAIETALSEDSVRSAFVSALTGTPCEGKLSEELQEQLYDAVADIALAWRKELAALEAKDRKLQKIMEECGVGREDAEIAMRLTPKAFRAWSEPRKAELIASELELAREEVLGKITHLSAKEFRQWREQSERDLAERKMEEIAKVAGKVWELDPALVLDRVKLGRLEELMNWCKSLKATQESERWRISRESILDYLNEHGINGLQNFCEERKAERIAHECKVPLEQVLERMKETSKDSFQAWYVSALCSVLAEDLNLHIAKVRALTRLYEGDDLVLACARETARAISEKYAVSEADALAETMKRDPQALEKWCRDKEVLKVSGECRLWHTPETARAFLDARNTLKDLPAVLEAEEPLSGREVLSRFIHVSKILSQRAREFKAEARLEAQTQAVMQETSGLIANTVDALLPRLGKAPHGGALALANAVETAWGSLVANAQTSDSLTELGVSTADLKELGFLVDYQVSMGARVQDATRNAIARFFDQKVATYENEPSVMYGWEYQAALRAWDAFAEAGRITSELALSKDEIVKRLCSCRGEQTIVTRNYKLADGALVDVVSEEGLMSGMLSGKRLHGHSAVEAGLFICCEAFFGAGDFTHESFVKDFAETLESERRIQAHDETHAQALHAAEKAKAERAADFARTTTVVSDAVAGLMPNRPDAGMQERGELIRELRECGLNTMQEITLSDEVPARRSFGQVVREIAGNAKSFVARAFGALRRSTQAPVQPASAA